MSGKVDHQRISGATVYCSCGIGWPCPAALGPPEFDAFVAGAPPASSAGGSPEPDERPGGWVDGIGWVAVYPLPWRTRCKWFPSYPDWEVGSIPVGPWEGRLCIVTRWADGTVPARPVPGSGERPDTADRDAMWCAALVGALSIDQVGDVLALFERIRSGEVPLPEGWIDAQPAPSPGPLVDVTALPEWEALVEFATGPATDDGHDNEGWAHFGAELVAVVLAAAADRRGEES